MSMYPVDEEIIVNGEIHKYPGMGEDGKFLSGSPTDPLQKASYLPGETINLILDNISNVIAAAGMEPNNSGLTQLRDAIKELSDPMPIGTILMFDANNPGGAQGGASGPWVDNETMPGWYACIPENVDRGCPNMVNRFPLGKAIAGAGSSGGSATATLAVENLPAHNHTMNHTHGTFTSTAESATHSHTVSDPGHSHGLAADGKYPITGIGTGVLQAGTGATTIIYGGSIIYATNAATTGISLGTQSANHTHNITVSAFSGNTGDKGNGVAFSILNPFYAFVYARKCA